MLCSLELTVWQVSSVSLAKDEWGRALILVGMKHEGSYGVIDHSGEVSYQSFDELFNKQVKVPPSFLPSLYCC